MVDRKDKRFFDFMCFCDEEGMEHCEKTYDEVMASLNEERKTTDKTFLDHIVFAMNWDLEHGAASIEGIPTDQWSGISVEYHHYGKRIDNKDANEEKNQKFFVECDRVHHGLARVYQLVKAYDESLASLGEEDNGRE